MKDLTTEDLGLSEEEMERIIDGARVAYGNEYPNEPAPAAKPLKLTPTARQLVQQRSKVYHAPKRPFGRH